MNCLAKETVYTEQVYRTRRQYGIFFLEWIDASLGEIMAREFGWRAKRLSRFFENERGGLTYMLNRYRADHIRVKDRRGARDAYEIEILDDALTHSMDRMTADLREIGFIFDERALQTPDPFSEHWRVGHDREKHAVRLSWYSGSGKSAAEAYVCAALLYFHDEEGFGKDRLGRLFEPLAAEVRRFVCEFLRSNAFADDRIRSSLDAKHRYLESCGVVLEEMPEEDAVVVSRKPASAMEKVSAHPSGKVPEECESILADVRRGYMKRLFK